MVRRRHGSDPDRTRTELEKLIQSQTVLKVSYKGSISYRNAAKVLRKSRKKSELVASGGESSRREHLNNSSDRAQSFIDPDPEEASVGPSEPQLRPDYPISTGYDRAAPPDQQTASASSTNINSGQQLEGCSLPSRVGHTTSSHNTSVTDESSDVNCLNNKTLTLPSQTQGPSKVRTTNFAHSDRLASVHSLPAASIGHTNPLGLKDILGYLSSQERLCGEKLTRGNVKVVMEREVAWGRLRRTRCGNITLLRPGAAPEEPSDWGKVHSSLENDPMQTESGDKEGWQNTEEHSKKDVPLCYEEDAGIPRVALTTEQEPTQKSRENAEIQTASKQHWTKGKSCSDFHSRALWELETCPTAVLDQSVGDIDESSCLLTPTASPVDSGVSDEPLSAGLLSPIDWTVSDVVSYFTEAGFPEQASAFKTQEIDGKALLLMQRNDVLTGLSIKLGPALKIYEHHVKALQKTHFEDDDL